MDAPAWKGAGVGDCRIAVAGRFLDSAGAVWHFEAARGRHWRENVNVDVMLSAAVGVLGAIACCGALAAALTIKTWRETFGPESLLLLAVALISAWCVVDAVYLQANVGQLVILVFAATHAIRMMHATSRAKRMSAWKTGHRDPT